MAKPTLGGGTAQGIADEALDISQTEVHNIQERQAMQSAKAQASLHLSTKDGSQAAIEGLTPSSNDFQNRVEMARWARQSKTS